MDIEVDYNPTPSKMFFISVALNDKEAISFDYTTKAHRVIKQVLVEKKPFPRNKKISSEWDALVLKDRKFVRRYHVKWIDMAKKDWVNNEIWETVWEKPIPKKLKDKLMTYSHLISDNYKDLEKFPEKMKEFEEFLLEELARQGIKNAT